MFRHRQALLGQGALCDLLIYRLMHFKGERGVRNVSRSAHCVILRQHFQVTRIHAQTLFLQGEHFYKQQLFSDAAKSWGQATMLQHGASHAFLATMMYEGRQGVRKKKVLVFEVASAGAALGCPHSKGVLGCCYVFGHGVERDKARGLALGRESAATGSCFGQFVVGKYYDSGSEENDDDTAMLFFKLAAAQGHAAAQCCLGSMFANADGVPQDDVEAVKWWRLAAAQGYDVAQYSLGWMLINGRGVTLDYTEAAQWLSLATAQGYEAAQSLLESMIRYCRI
jgi:TPR repeat protein